MATGLAKLGVQPHVIGAILNHAPQGVTAQVYNRYSYAKEKREALDLWAQHVAAVIERYKPAPTEDEIRAEEWRQGIRANNKRRTKTLEEANAAALAALAALAEIAQANP